MAITNFAELQQQIIDYSHRADLASKIPDFIRICEDIIYGDIDVRQLDVLTTLSSVASVETITLPSDFVQSRSLALQSTTPQSPLDYLTPEQYNQSFQYGTSGKPIAYTIVSSNLMLRPIPDAVYSFNMVYTARIPPLNSTNTTNWLITNYPSVYLYAAMVQLCLYIKADFKQWESAYEKAIQGLNMNDWMNASNLSVRQDINLVSRGK